MTVSPMARFQKQLEDLASDCRLVRVAAPLGPGGVTNRNSFALNHPGSDHAHYIPSGLAAPPGGLAGGTEEMMHLCLTHLHIISLVALFHPGRRRGTK